MSTYYEYQDVKNAIVHRLFALDGWKIYGYHADNSDPMTDYYDPEWWDGIATKNGYTLVIDKSWDKEPRTYKVRKNPLECTPTLNKDISEKIAKLEAMTVERGASEEEERSAKEKIEKLLAKRNEEAEKDEAENYIEVYEPGYMKNPPRCNWHIEKDGIIIEKGTGLLKFAELLSYIKYSLYKEDLDSFKKDKNAWIKNERQEMKEDYYYGRYDDDRIESIIKDRANRLEGICSLMEKFDKLINKFDTTCGGMLGEGGYTYEKVIVTEYKKENKVFEDESGSIKDGQCYTIKSSGFNYGVCRGYVYRIHECTYYNGEKYYKAYRLNGKLTKECTGSANSANTWYIDEEKFNRWIAKGSLVYCHIEEVKTPYQVEKVIKKPIKPNKEKNTNKTDNAASNTENINADNPLENLEYTIIEDIDTRDNSTIYLLKVMEKLTREDYITVNKYIKTLGGYYSKFKHGFLFREYPETLRREVV